MKWQVEEVKQGVEIYVNCEDYSIIIGEGYSQKEKQKILRIANIIAKALNKKDFPGWAKQRARL
jgi:hypothetical protein